MHALPYPDLIDFLRSTVKLVATKYLNRNPDLAYNIPMLVRVFGISAKEELCLAEIRTWVDISTNGGISPSI